MADCDEEFIFRLPLKLLETARARRKLISPRASTFAFRMVVISATLAIDPALGHFRLRYNNSTDQFIDLIMIHVQEGCNRKAFIRESTEEACVKIRVQGACTCHATLQQTIESKIDYVAVWQGTSKHLPTELTDTLKSVCDRIDKKIQPVSTAAEREILRKHCGQDALDALLGKYFTSEGPTDGDESASRRNAAPTQCEGKEESEVESTGVKISGEVGVEGWLFQLLGITKFFLKFAYEGPTRKVKTPKRNHED